MRLLITAPAGLGHVHPLLPLARAARDRDHDVVLATDAETCARVERTGIRAVAAGVTLAERQRRSLERFGSATPPTGRDHADFGFPRVFGVAAMPPMVEDLRRVVAELRPDLIVHDAAELAAPLVAAEHGIRHATHSFGTTVPLHRLAMTGELTSELWANAGLEQPAYAGLFDDIYIDIRPPSLAGHPPAGTLVLPERPTSSDMVGGELPPFVSSGDDRPLVYVTLGTIFSNAEILRSTISALAAARVRILITVGPHGDPAVLGPLPDHVHVERYVPQALLFEHCDVVISHAGSGTFLGALSHGLPLLCLPQAADQFLNADAGVEVGAALAIEPADITAASIRDAVDELLGVPSYRSNARRIADEIASMPTATEVVEQLEQLVRQ